MTDTGGYHPISSTRAFGTGELKDFLTSGPGQTLSFSVDMSMKNICITLGPGSVSNKSEHETSQIFTAFYYKKTDNAETLLLELAMTKPDRPVQPANTQITLHTHQVWQVCFYSSLFR